MATSAALGISGELSTASAATFSVSQVANIRPNDPNWPDDAIQHLTNVSGTVYFSGNDGTDGYQLWKSDGTSAGTSAVVPSTTVSRPEDLTNVGGTLFFSGSDGTNYELWKSNGTGAGTVEITKSNQLTHVGNLLNVGGILYFSAKDTTSGSSSNGNYELWKWDGAAVTEITHSSTLTNPRYLTNVNGTLFFAAKDTTPLNATYGDYELWKWDGTTVTEVLGTTTLTHPQSLTNVGGTLFFSGNDGTNNELWKSAPGDSTATKVPSGSTLTNPEDLTDVGGTLFFSGSDGTNFELWTSDGTTATEITHSTKLTDPRELTNVSGTAYFDASSSSGYEVWKSNGTDAGTSIVSASAHYPSSLTNVGGTLMFAASDGMHGYELWQSDGTSPGTVMVKDINPGPSSSRPKYLTNVAGTLYFAANDGNGAELWKATPPTSPFIPPPLSIQAMTGTEIGSSQNPSNTGQPVTFTATVSPAPDGGTVQFTDPGTTIAGCGKVPVDPKTGQATCTTTFSSQGQYPIQANYSGDAKYQPSQSPVMTQVVNVSSPNPPAKPTATRIRLLSSAQPAKVGQQVLYTAQISPVPDGGRVAFLDDGKLIPGCENLLVSARGTAICKVTYRKPGVHKIQAGYAGDAHYANAASSKLKETVRAKRTRRRR